MGNAQAAAPLPPCVRRGSLPKPATTGRVEGLGRRAATWGRALAGWCRMSLARLARSTQAWRPPPPTRWSQMNLCARGQARGGAGAGPVQ